jgi:pimeloyl-ACP methyl ester carboxylesterase
MPEIDLDGSTLYYFEHETPGSPFPPLLLIHGAGGYHRFWPSQLRRLNGVTVYTPDLPGRGRSTGPGRQTVAQYTADMLRLLDALNIQQAILAGHSMGGAIAQQLALDAPERVAGLVLISTGARLRVTPQILDNVLDNFDTVVETVINFAYGPTADDDLKQTGKRELHEVKPEVVLGDYTACDGFDVISRLGEIAAPALVVGGSADRMTPAKYSQYLADNLPDAGLHIVENAGHMLPVEFPDRVADIVLGWLKKRWTHE